MTYNQIVYNLRNLYRGGISSDDDNISDRQLIFIFNYYRAKLIREDLNKRRTLDRQLIQNLGCVPVECVDAAECCEITDSGTSVIRTVNPLPKFLELHDKNLLTYVGTVDKLTAFQISTATLAKWSAHNKYTSKSPKAFIMDDRRYLYLTNAPKGIELINIMGVFEDPQAASEYKHCSGEPCFTPNSEYPISAHMVPIINELIISKDLQLLISTPTDETNDATENAGV